MMKLVTIRLILTLDLTSNRSIQHVDVNNAFLNGLLEKDNYDDTATGFKLKKKISSCL